MTHLPEDLPSLNYSTQDQISDLQKKIHLAEGDLKAFREFSQEKILKNFQKIKILRRQNKDYHKLLASRLDADQVVIDQAFDNADKRLKEQAMESNNENIEPFGSKNLKNLRIRSADVKERTALRNKSGEAANELLDQALCDQKKRLNAMKAETNKKKLMLKDLQTTYDQLIKEASFSADMSKGESKAAQKLTTLENRLDMARRKSAEAVHINKVYQMIHQYLEEESLTFHSQLDELEQQIKKSRQELEDIRRMYEDAQESRDAARQELINTEERISCQRRAHEQRLAELKDQAQKVQRQARSQNYEKKNIFSSESEGSGNRTSMFERRSSKPSKKSETNYSSEEPLTIEEYDSSAHAIEQNAKINELEAHFAKIKEATGVSELAQVVSRFEAQARTHAELEEKRQSNIDEKKRLQEKLISAKIKLAEQKYGDAGSDSKQQKFKIQLDEAIEKLEIKKKETSNLQVKAEESKLLVSNLTHALANLTDKLERVRLTKSEEKTTNFAKRGGSLLVSTLSPESISEVTIDDYFDRCNSRIDALLANLPNDQDLESILEQSRTDDVYLSALETKMPEHNIRVSNINQTVHNNQDNSEEGKQNQQKKHDGKNFHDDSESGEDEGGYISREQLKKASNQLVDSKSKKRSGARSRKSVRRRF